MAAPPSRISADHAKSGLALACDIGPTKNIKDLTSLNLVEDIVSPRTTTLDNDFINVNPSTSVEAQFQNSRVKNFARFDCKVILTYSLLSVLFSRGAWRRLNDTDIVCDALSSGINPLITLVLSFGGIWW